jgi:hypothetical protein
LLFSLPLLCRFHCQNILRLTTPGGLSHLGALCEICLPPPLIYNHVRYITSPEINGYATFLKIDAAVEINFVMNIKSVMCGKVSSYKMLQGKLTLSISCLQTFSPIRRNRGPDRWSFQLKG